MNIKSIRDKIKAHKLLSAIVFCLIAFGTYYFFIRTTAPGETRYVTATVERGTIVSTVSGTGQVSVLNQLDIKPQASGIVNGISAAPGKPIKAGELILTLDATDAQKSVRDAEAALQSAKIALQKLEQPADAATLTQYQNDLAQAKQSKQNAQDSLAKDYDTAFNNISNAFIDLPIVVNGLQGVLNGTTVNGNSGNAYAYADMIRNYVANTDQFRDGAIASYQKALAAYTQNLTDYKNTSRYSDRSTIDALLAQTYDTTKLLAEAVKDSKNFLDLVSNTLTQNANTKIPAILTTHESSLQTYTGTASSDLAGLLAAKNTIRDDINSAQSAELSITQKTQALAKLQAGADTLDLESQRLAVTQKQNTLQDARDNLSHYYIRAPFDGIVASIPVKKGDPAGSGTTVATVITTQQIANISLNEVDVAKVHLGNKVTLTFDALSDLTLTGTVSLIDTIGTVSQGVVSYNVRITFDTQNDQIKPGMTVSAAIITDTRPDVLVVPNSAIKSQGSARYVQILELPASTSSSTSASGSTGVLSATPPRNQVIETGLASDSLTEITSGLSGGETIVTRTITSSSTAAKASTATGSGLRIPGLGGTGR